jgi:hypothetical protein
MLFLHQFCLLVKLLTRKNNPVFWRLIKKGKLTKQSVYDIYFIEVYI